MSRRASQIDRPVSQGGLVYIGRPPDEVQTTWEPHDRAAATTTEARRKDRIGELLTSLPHIKQSRGYVPPIGNPPPLWFSK
jgi:hypothetical protein